MVSIWLPIGFQASPDLVACNRRPHCYEIIKVNLIAIVHMEHKPLTQKKNYDPVKYKTPTGSVLQCKGWIQEAALRMLLNNLNPEAAPRTGSNRYKRSPIREWSIPNLPVPFHQRYTNFRNLYLLHCMSLKCFQCYACTGHLLKDIHCSRSSFGRLQQVSFERMERSIEIRSIQV